METASLIARQGDKYLIQVRDVKRIEFSRGEYPFIFPGACSLFGGRVEEGEDAKTALKRELAEELLGIILPETLEHRSYNWSTQLDEVYERINEAFHGNADSFMGFDLESNVPPSALGRNRGKSFTYREFIAIKDQDHFYVGDFNQENLANTELKEGEAHLWIPHYLLKSVVMDPTDKLAVLDDIVIRSEKGELEL